MTIFHVFQLEIFSTQEEVEEGKEALTEQLQEKVTFVRNFDILISLSPLSLDDQD